MELPGKLEPDNPLWRFALAFWQNAEARQACLALQEQGWSVTRLLCAGWLALSGRRYDGQEDATLTKWRQDVTGALRTARRALPKGSEACRELREAVARLELQAEQLELAMAWNALKPTTPEHDTMQGRRQLIEHNLARAANTSRQAHAATGELNTLARLLANFSHGDIQP
ncbi:TIGR02444 family protein [Marinobacter lutaoensis]|uniref:TIGR02444 family protein n=1 Tax=Marinobacter lutaoensis TaxID=135739 RepID=A0A1V2DVL9_9GAMM|nr:DUF2390 domain-containing protein [Marinobacter sp.]MBI44126.1 DUF2390 domain-containing protein [Oceanospirillales bacterium]NVD36648.1 TIGR02444 family protein [Marinobacter lutaoensis]ONF44795.1 TIGR02444 family protein [Marinobacter lutaoensis]